jgi:predicted TPR repeat methyltransferase
MALAALQLGMALSYAGDRAGACDAFRRAALLAPRQAAPWIGLGSVEAASGAREAAAAAFREALKREGDDSFVQHLLDAAEGNTTALAPPAFGARIFDELAAIYESLLARDGDLRAQPQLAKQLLRLQPGRLFASMLDIGCGTGALARALAATTRRRSGLDPSRRMLDSAKLTRLYDDVIEQPPIAYLAATQERYELITAAEMLPYIGDLAPLFDEFLRHLQPGGVFAGTVDRLEGAEGGNFLLRLNGRYAHAEGYVSALAQERGLEVLHLERIDLKRGRGEMTPCVVTLFQQPG